MAGRVYLETSIVSYLAALPSRDLITVARQQLTHDWWRRRRPGFEVYVSELVVAESRSGDPDAAKRRLAVLTDLPLLDITPAATELAAELARAARFPRRAAADALHIAIAACQGMDYLLTWNSAHIANAELRPHVERACREGGYRPPVLCTPDVLMGGQDNG